MTVDLGQSENQKRDIDWRQAGVAQDKEVL